jgi:anti-anti-sigma regulatory factor
MLKISFIDTRTRCLLLLEGKLIAPWATELRSAYEKVRADLNGRELVIELRHITAISQEGENVILELINDGVKFCSSGVFTKHTLKQLTRRARMLGRRSDDSTGPHTNA